MEEMELCIELHGQEMENGDERIVLEEWIVII